MRRRTSAIWLMPEDDFRKLVARCFTITAILSEFGMQNKGGNARTLTERLEHLGIDYSHIPRGKCAGNTAMVRAFRKRYSLTEVCVKGSKYSRSSLKRRLIDSGELVNECSECGQESEWNGKNLVLVLDHKNGVSDDNRKSNLRLLCPNCNSQQSTFSGRNARLIK